MDAVAAECVPTDVDLRRAYRRSEFALMRKMSEFGDLIALCRPRPRPVPSDALRARIVQACSISSIRTARCLAGTKG